MSNRITDIIFFIESPFNKRDYERFGIDLLQLNGFKVEVWDFTPIINSEVYKRVKVPDPFDFYGHKLFFSKDEVFRKINQLSENSCLVVFFMGYTFKSLFLFRAISKKKIRYAVFMANALPLPNSKITFLKKIKNITPDNLLNFFFRRTPCWLFGVKSAWICLAGGSKSTTIYRYPVDSKTETLWCHSMDYDLYLKEIKAKDDAIENYQNKNYAVFLDEYLPYHPDYIHHKIPPPTSADKYYPKLCKFFDLVESVLGMEVVIAAHPRAHYENHPHIFGGRKIIQFKTAKLVKNSKLVLLHASTSVNYAILFKKPCIFITTKDIQRSHMGPYIEKISSLLGIRPINLDEKIELENERIFFVNDELYNEYIDSYIKKRGSKEGPFWRIVADFLKEYK